MKNLFFLVLGVLVTTSAAYSKDGGVDCAFRENRNSFECRNKKPKGNLKDNLDKCRAAHPDKTTGYCVADMFGVHFVGEQVVESKKFVADKSEKISDELTTLIQEINVTQDECYTILRKEFGIQIVGDKAMMKNPKNPSETLVYTYNGMFRLEDQTKPVCKFQKGDGKNRLVTRDSLLNSVKKSENFPEKCREFLNFPKPDKAEEVDEPAEAPKAKPKKEEKASPKVPKPKLRPADLNTTKPAAKPAKKPAPKAPQPLLVPEDPVPELPAFNKSAQ